MNEERRKKEALFRYAVLGELFNRVLRRGELGRGLRERAGTVGPYAGTRILDDMGWHRGNSGNKAQPVGRKKANQFGLHDMHGNVKEFCLDVYDRDFYKTSGATARDPVCVSGSEGRVMRGGCFYVGEKACRSADRNRIMAATDEAGNVGFRIAFNLR